MDEILSINRSSTPVTTKTSEKILNRTFDLTTDSEEMLTSRLKPESRLSSGVVKQSQVLGSRSTSSTCSTTSSNSASSNTSNLNSKVQPVKNSNLQFQMKFNKFNGNTSQNLTNTSTPNNKVISKHVNNDGLQSDIENRIESKPSLPGK